MLFFLPLWEAVEPRGFEMLSAIFFLAFRRVISEDYQLSKANRMGPLIAYLTYEAGTVAAYACMLCGSWSLYAVYITFV